MNIASTILALKKNYSVRGGPIAPSKIRPHVLPLATSNRERQTLEKLLARQQRRLIYGVTITAVALGYRNPKTFSTAHLVMPVFHRLAPLGGAAPRSQIVKALVAQNLAHLAVCYAQALGAAILLCQLRPGQAWQLFSADAEGTLYFAASLEMLVGLPVYALVVAVEMGVRVGRAGRGFLP